MLHSLTVKLYCSGKQCRDAQDAGLLWRDKTGPACFQLTMSRKVFMLLLPLFGISDYAGCSPSVISIA